LPRSKLIPDEKVLDAVERVLLERGPHGLTLKHVSRRSGIAPATLIQRFGSKKGLLRAFGRHAAKKAEKRPAISDEPPLKVLMRTLVDRAANIGDRRAFVNSMSMLLEDIRDEHLRSTAARQAFSTELVIERLLDDAGYSQPEKAARVVYAAWNGALIQWALRGEGSLEKYVKKTLAETLALVRR
jgi:AcrR family transcriptional regulator